MKPVHIIILSTKSAGSTALMDYFIQNHSFKTVAFTKHSEKETLYWTKAATLLRMNQDKLYRSKISFKPEKVWQELNEFLRSNKVSTIKPSTSNMKDEIFRAYRDLVFAYGPRFIEKSPHHLYNRSNLTLLNDFIHRYAHEIEFKVIGLVRSPMDVIYSAWDRWKFIPDEFEHEWTRSYENLCWVRETFPLTSIVQYEALAKDNTAIDSLAGSLPGSKKYSINTNSLNKWRRDNFFSHHLSKGTTVLAGKLGYKEFDYRTNIFWSIIVYYYKLRWKVRSMIKR
jgi:hypothetical protein